MELDRHSLLHQLHQYFISKKAIAFAFLFGSEAKNLAGQDSDIDIAVYFYPKNEGFDFEDDVIFQEEDGIWNDLTRIAGKEVDFIVLNRAAATIAAAVYLEGVPIIINSHHLYWQHFFTVTDLAEEYRNFVGEYIAVKSRSLSLSAIDKDRLIRILDFLETELADAPSFNDVNRTAYLNNSAYRRNIERWIENLVNTSIDLAKVIAASNKQPIPQTYRETLLRLETIAEFDTELAQQLSGFTKLRNILAHEYLDIKYPQIEKFVKTAPPVYYSLLTSTKNYLKTDTS